MTRVAWIGTGHESVFGDGLGQIPETVTLVAEPGPGVQFASPGWGDAASLAGLTALEVVQVRSAGVDWIAPYVPAGVTLCSGRGTRDRPVAEWILAAILADLKQARRMAAAQAAGRWDGGLRFQDLAGKHVLILGHGSIGRMTERMLGAFAATVTGVARHARDGVHGLDELDALLGHADVLVNLLPITEETRGFVGPGVLARLPDGALVVNAGRGQTQDTDALLAELRRGRLRAVLDVTDPEPLPEGHPLWTAPGVIISPHQAGNTVGADRAAWALVGDQLRRWAAGEPLQNVVAGEY